MELILGQYQAAAIEVDSALGACVAFVEVQVDLPAAAELAYV